MSDVVTTLERTSHQLEALRARVRRAVWFDAFGLVALRFVAFAAISVVADRSFELERPVRAILLVGLCALLVDTIRRRAIRPLATELSKDELALAFERGSALHERLISAIQFAGHGGRARGPGVSDAMIRAVLDETESRANELSVATAIEPAFERRSMNRLLGSIAVVVLAFAVFPGPTSTWARRNLLLGTEAWPRETTLRFVDVPSNGLRIGPETDLRLAIEVEGVVPDEVSVTAQTDDGRRFETRAALVQDGRFRVVLERLRDSVTLRARGGDGVSESIRVEVVPPPRLIDLEWTAQLPPYLDDRSGADAEATDPTRRSEVLRVVRGGRAVLRVRADKALRLVELRRTTRVDPQSDEPRKFTATTDGVGASLSFEPQSDAVLELHVEDGDGIDLAIPPRLALQVVEDAPPAVESTTPGVGSMLLRNARIPAHVSATDDHGLYSIAAFATVRREDDETASDGIPIDLSNAMSDLGPLADHPTTFERDFVCDLAELDPETLRVGDRLRLWFAATDARDADGQGRSEANIFRIVTRDELLEDLERRQREIRRDIEEVLLDLVELRAELAGDDGTDGSTDRSSRPRNFSERLSNAADRFLGVLDELGNNRLLGDRDVERLRGSVVDATRGVISGPLSRATTALETPIDRDRAIGELDRAAEELRRILNELDRAEGLPRLVELLKGLLDTTSRVETAIDQARSSQAADDIFGPGGGDNRENGGRDRDR